MDAIEFKNKLKEHCFTQAEFALITNTPVATVRTWCVRTEKSSRKVQHWVGPFFELLELMQRTNPIAADCYIANKTIRADEKGL